MPTEPAALSTPAHYESMLGFCGHYKLVFDEENPPRDVVIAQRSPQ